MEILTFGLKDCKECRLCEKGRALLLAARAQVGKRHKGMGMGVSVQVYNRRLRLLALWEKNFKGRWRVLAWMRADTDEVPIFQVGVFVEKI